MVNGKNFAKQNFKPFIHSTFQPFNQVGRSGEIGRRSGLKIHRGSPHVPVRVRPSAFTKKNAPFWVCFSLSCKGASPHRIVALQQRVLPSRKTILNRFSRHSGLRQLQAKARPPTELLLCNN